MKNASTTDKRMTTTRTNIHVMLAKKFKKSLTMYQIYACSSLIMTYSFENSTFYFLSELEPPNQRQGNIQSDKDAISRSNHNNPQAYTKSFKQILSKFLATYKLSSMQSIKFIAAIGLMAIIFLPAEALSKDTIKTKNAEVPNISTLSDRLEQILYLSKKANAGQEIPIPPEIMRQLLVALRDPSIEVRMRAIDAITGIGTGAEDAIPSLISILEDTTQPIDIRRNSVLAIRSIYAGEAVDPLKMALRKL